MDFIIQMGQRGPSPILLEIFSYVNNRSAIRFTQVNRATYRKLANRYRLSKLRAFKHMFKNRCPFCEPTLRRVLETGTRFEMETLMEFRNQWRNELGPKVTHCFFIYTVSFATQYRMEKIFKIGEFERARDMIMNNPCHYLHKPIKEGRFKHFGEINKFLSRAETLNLSLLPCWETGCHDDIGPRNMFEIVRDSNDMRFVLWFLIYLSPSA